MSEIDTPTPCQGVLHGAFAERTIVVLDSKQFLQGMEEFDYATGEASF
jgi:hypothetical protein